MNIQCHIPVNPVYAAFFRGDARMKYLAALYAKHRGYPVDFAVPELGEWEKSVAEQILDYFLKDRLNVDNLAQFLNAYQAGLTLQQMTRLDNYYLFVFK